MNHPSPRTTSTPARPNQGPHDDSADADAPVNLSFASAPRHTPRLTARKAYASENDSLALNPPRQPQAPQTPRKTASGSPDLTNALLTQAATKPRSSRSRPKSKQASFSGPGPTSPHSVPLPKTAPSTAFAGATFHASPAPSALPIPSFLAKPSSDSPSQQLPRAFAEEPSPPATDTDLPTPFRPSSDPRSNQSPLDFMFRAHREERQRHSRATTDAREPGPATTRYPSSRSPPGLAAFPNTPSLPSTQRSLSLHPSRGLDGPNLDGASGLPVGPAFATPYQERIKAARSSASRASALGQGLAEMPPKKSSASEDAADALKKLLFGSEATSQHDGPSAAHPAPSAAPPPLSQVATSAPQPSSAWAERPDVARAGNLQAMEDDLRRILRLEKRSDSSSHDGGLFTR